MISNGIGEQVGGTPYKTADDASQHAFTFSVHGNRRDKHYHPVAIDLHTKALKEMAKAVEQARTSADIQSIRKYKILFVRHQQAREAHQMGHKSESMAGEIGAFKETVILRLLIEEVRSALARSISPLMNIRPKARKGMKNQTGSKAIRQAAKTVLGQGRSRV